MELVDLAFLHKNKTAGLQKAALYCVENKGKRIRPHLLFLFGEMLGVAQKQLLDPALAIECIHLYSCIHDDLPCMDDDDYRRGVPTVHKMFGEDIAVLTGDFFLTLAFEIIAKSSIAPEKKVELTKILAEKAGGSGMLAGQFLDLHPIEKPSEEDLLFLHEKKTACLLQAAAQFACVLSSCGAREEIILQKFATAVGITYQLTDDILDTTSTVAILGKPIGSDKKNGKCTSMALYGSANASKKAFFWYKRSLQELEKLDRNTQELVQFTTSLFHRNY